MQIAETQKLILGAPGCGKTTRLLQILEEELEDGVEPTRIAYVSFTKQAVDEAVSRVVTKFGFSADDLTFFRTLHSLCFRVHGLNRSDVMDKHHYVELGTALGYTFGQHRINPEDGFPVTGNDGDRLLFVNNLARNRRVTAEQQWHDLSEFDLDIFALKRLNNELESYKREHSLLDFTDMLQQTVDSQRVVDVDVAIIDEAQDLSVLQWAVCQSLFRNAKRVYIAGDDDQAIYRWAGADVETFLSLTGKQEVLGLSHRLPRSVYNVAQRIAGRIAHRYPKTWRPRDDEGEVHSLPHLEVVDYALPGTWMILARNNYMLSEAEVLLRARGMPYIQRDGSRSVNYEHFLAILSWERMRKGQTITGTEAKRIYTWLRPGTGVKRGYKGKSVELVDDQMYDMYTLQTQHGLVAEGIWHDALDGIGLGTREYYVTALRAGYKLNEQPQVRIGSIHSVKGGEADNVVLLTDMSWRTFQGYQKFPDDEQRVFYVGATRAKQRLFILQAGSPQSFDI